MSKYKKILGRLKEKKAADLDNDLKYMELLSTKYKCCSLCKEVKKRESFVHGACNSCNQLFSIDPRCSCHRFSSNTSSISGGCCVKCQFNAVQFSKWRSEIRRCIENGDSNDFIDGPQLVRRHNIPAGAKYNIKFHDWPAIVSKDIFLDVEKVRQWLSPENIIISIRPAKK